MYRALFDRQYYSRDKIPGNIPRVGHGGNDQRFKYLDQATAFCPNSTSDNTNFWIIYLYSERHNILLGR